MENDNNCADLADHGRTSYPRGFYPAIAVSVLVHLVMAWSVASLRLGKDIEPAPVTSMPVVLLSLRSNPPPPPAIVEDPPAPIPDTSDALEPQQEAAPAAPPMEQQSTSSPAATETSSVIAVHRPSSSNPDAQSSPGTLSADQLRTSISSFMNTYKTEQQTSWLEQCQLFRNRYFTNDCTLDPAVRTGNRVVPDSVIIPLLDDDSVAGELARERYALVAPPRNFSLIATREQQLTGPTISLLGIGSEGGGLIPALLQSLGLFRTRLAVPELTEAEILAELPASEIEEDQTVSNFERTPSVFGNSR